MIIRERSDEIVMIAQHDHAQLSGVFAKQWPKDSFTGINLRKNVEFAIREHDRAWIPLDKCPFWNQQTEAPFSFMDFPGPPKFVFYKQGIDETEKIDSYAAMLCSHHYGRFAENDSSVEANDFRDQEGMRQMKIRSSIACFSESDFQFHYELLSFTDTLSLFVCLNEPGFSSNHSSKGMLNEMNCPKESSSQLLKAEWRVPSQITLLNSPFKDVFEVKWRQKAILKKTVAEKGIMTAYQETPFEEQKVMIKGE